MKNSKLMGLLLIASLPLMAATCVKIKDSSGREKQIKNAANSEAQHMILQKIEKLKEDMENIQQSMYTLQDSINQSLFRSLTVRDMKFAQIHKEVGDVESVQNTMGSYLPAPSDPYTNAIVSAYQSDDLAEAATQIANVVSYPGGLSAPLPKDANQLMVAESGRQVAKLAFWEFADQRALQSATIMRQWADVYSEKAAELNQALLQTKRFTMTDFERIELQKEAEKYVILSYELLEKSDSITLAVSENEYKKKKKAEIALNNYNSLIKFYNP
jgi:hypothetical protein